MLESLSLPLGRVTQCRAVHLKHPTLFDDSMITMTYSIKVKTRNRYESKLRPQIVLKVQALFY